MNIHDPFLFRQTQVTTYTDIEIRQFQTPPRQKGNICDSAHKFRRKTQFQEKIKQLKFNDLQNKFSSASQTTPETGKS